MSSDNFPESHFQSATPTPEGPELLVRELSSVSDGPKRLDAKKQVSVSPAATATTVITLNTASSTEQNQPAGDNVHYM